MTPFSRHCVEEPAMQPRTWSALRSGGGRHRLSAESEFRWADSGPHGLCCKRRACDFLGKNAYEPFPAACAPHTVDRRLHEARRPPSPLTAFRRSCVCSLGYLLEEEKIWNLPHDVRMINEVVRVGGERRGERRQVGQVCSGGATTSACGIAQGRRKSRSRAYPTCSAMQRTPSAPGDGRTRPDCWILSHSWLSRRSW